MEIRDVVFGFFGGLAIFLFGMNLMSEGLKKMGNVAFKRILNSLTKNRFSAILVGLGITCLIQSSSATSVMAVGLVNAALLDLGQAIAVVLGADIGTTITAQLAALGGTKGARGVAMANTFFKLLGVCLFLPLLLTGVFQGAVEAVFPAQLDPKTGANTVIMVQIAAAHTAYIAINVVLFSTILWPVLLRLSKWASQISDDEASNKDTIYLDPLLLDNPPIALEQCITQLTYMTRQSYKNITMSFEAFLDRDLSEVKKIEQREERIDELQEEITSYLVELSSRELAHATSRAIPKIIHCINDAERIGDHAENLTELTELAISNKRTFSLDAKRELLNYYGLVDRQFKAVLKALKERQQDSVIEAQELEDQINKQQEVLIQNHIARLEEGTCTVQAGLVFLDSVANLEKIGDHLVNIAERLDVS